MTHNQFSVSAKTDTCCTAPSRCRSTFCSAVQLLQDCNLAKPFDDPRHPTPHTPQEQQEPQEGQEEHAWCQESKNGRITAPYSTHALGAAVGARLVSREQKGLEIYIMGFPTCNTNQNRKEEAKGQQDIYVQDSRHKKLVCDRFFFLLVYSSCAYDGIQSGCEGGRSNYKT